MTTPTTTPDELLARLEDIKDRLNELRTDVAALLEASSSPPHTTTLLVLDDFLSQAVRAASLSVSVARRQVDHG